MIGTRAISGSLAIRCRKRTIAALLSSIASSMLTSITWAPFSTCWRATLSASSNLPFRISRAKAFEPVTLVRSPMLTNSDGRVDRDRLEAGQFHRRRRAGCGAAASDEAGRGVDRHGGSQWQRPRCSPRPSGSGERCWEDKPKPGSADRSGRRPSQRSLGGRIVVGELWKPLSTRRRGGRGGLRPSERPNTSSHRRGAEDAEIAEK